LAKAELRNTAVSDGWEVFAAFEPHVLATRPAVRLQSPQYQVRVSAQCIFASTSYEAQQSHASTMADIVKPNQRDRGTSTLLHMVQQNLVEVIRS